MNLEALRAKKSQLPKTSPEEGRAIAVAGFAFLPMFLKEIKREERKALVEISEVLQAFKEGKAEELEVVLVFLENIKDGGIEGLRGKKEMLKEAYEELKNEKVEEFWRYIRSWAGAGKEEIFSHFIRNKKAKEEIIKKALAWWAEEAEKEKDKISKKAEERKVERLKELVEKGKKRDLSEEELLFLLDNDPSGGDLLLSYEEEKERRELEKKAKSGKGVEAQDL